MRVNNTNKKIKRARSVALYVFISIFILMVALCLSNISSGIMWASGLAVDKTGIVADMLGGVMAAVAAGLVLFQLRESEKEQIRQNDIEEASFILQYNQAFIQDHNMAEVHRLLESQAHYGEEGDVINDDNRQLFVNYLVYLEGLAPLIIEEILNLEHIDDLMAYRFFLAVNNKEVQEKELKRFPDYYRGCYKLYDIWSKYRKSKGLEILMEENALDRWERYSDYAKR